MKISLANKPAGVSEMYLFLDLPQPASRAYSFEDFEMLRSETAAPEPLAENLVAVRPLPTRSLTKRVRSTTASAGWHTRRQRKFRRMNLNWRGELYKNERRTRPLVHPDLPPKLYLDHAAYVAAWRAKREKL